MSIVRDAKRCLLGNGTARVCVHLINVEMLGVVDADELWDAVGRLRKSTRVVAAPAIGMSAAAAGLRVIWGYPWTAMRSAALVSLRGFRGTKYYSR